MFKRVLVGLIGSILLSLISGCWPGIPIVAGIAASGGSSGSSRAVLVGTIILEDPGITSLEWSEELEPNDGIGLSTDLGTWDGATRGGLRGRTGPRLRWHAVLADASGGRRFSEQDLLSAEGERQRAVAEGVRVLALARDADALYVVHGGDEVTVSVRGAALGLERASYPLPIEGTLRDVDAAHGALWIIEQDAGAALPRLVVIAPETGERLFQSSLPARSLELAVGEELATGALRVFTADAEGAVWEIEVASIGDDRVLGTPRRLELARLPERIGAMSYDGCHLWVGHESAAWVNAYQPQGAALVGRMVTDAPLAALAAEFDLDMDSFRVRRPAGAVAMELHSAGDGQPFYMVLDRDAALRGEDPLREFVRFEAGRPHAARLGAHGAGTELVLGSLGGSFQYELRCNLAPALQQLAAPPSGALPAEIARSLSTQLGALEPARLAQCWAEVGLSEHLPEQIAVGRAATAQGEHPSQLGVFELELERRSLSGIDVMRWARPTAEPRLRRVGGQVLPAEARRRVDLDTMSVLAELERSGTVDWCEPMYLARSLAEPNDPLWPAQTWQHEALRLPDAWDETTGDRSIIVAVVDSGVRTENSDLSPNLIDGYDFVSGVGNSGDGNGIDANPYDAGGPDSHGTHVAGSIGARGNNEKGVTGAMWNCRVMPVRAIGADGSGSIVDIAEGIRYAARLGNVSGLLPAEAADVINLSLGAPSSSNALLSACQDARAQGIVLVAATGNNGQVGVLFPAAYDETIAIGATTIEDGRAEYSNIGPEVDLVAPGGENTDLNFDSFPDLILSTAGSNDQSDAYTYLAGTSMACANAAGAIGLLLSVSPNLSPDAVQQLLQSTARDLGTAGKDTTFGHGIIDIAAAIDATQPALGLNVGELSLGRNGTRSVVQASNLGGGTLSLVALALTPPGPFSAELMSDGTTIAVRANREGLADGVHAATLVVNSNGGSQSVELSLTQSSAPLPDVGTVLVQMLDADMEQVFATSTTVDDVYEYAIRGFDDGRYFLRCGVDANADGVLADSEVTGGYPAPPPNLAPIDLVRDGDREIDIVLD